ncbi:MAG: hypothetical protein SFY92_04685 [Verrucomicrobiae bacterium]|nr:hypothetical protein [Verrucomicrobiae bacterium]
MKTIPCSQNSSCRGSALVWTLIIVSSLSFLLAAAIALNSHTRSMASRGDLALETAYAAEVCLATIYKDVGRMLDQTDYTNVTYGVVSSNINMSTAPSAFINTSRVEIINYGAIPLSSNGVPSNFSHKNGGERDNRFLAVAWVRSRINPNVVTKLQQEIQYTFEPLFYYGVFYVPNLEFHSGPAMAMTGKIHSNASIFFYTFSTNTFNGPVTSAGSPLNTYGGQTVYARFGGDTNTWAQFTPNTTNFNYNSTNNSFRYTFTNVSGTVSTSYNAFAGGLPSPTGSKLVPGMNGYGGTTITNSTNYGSNYSTNGAIALIKRPVYTNSFGQAVTDPYALDTTADQDSTVNSKARLYYKAGLRVIVPGTSNAGRLPQFYYGNASSNNPYGTTAITPYITNTYTLPGPITTNIIVPNLTYQTLTGAFNANGKMSDYRWSGQTNSAGQTVSNMAYLARSNVVTTEFDVSKILNTGANVTNAPVHTNITRASIYTTNIGTNVVTVSNTTPFEFNGVVYVSNIDGTSSNKTGVTMKNATNIPNITSYDNSAYNSSNIGMTVVTDNPMYLLGDYNTGGTNTLANTSNTANNPTYGLTNSTVTGYSRRPAAVFADAVTILSSRYGGYLGQTKSGSRDAIHTTYNVAIVAGQSPVDSNTVTGGLHNFPRFLEDWGSQRATINGSIVNLFNSEQATARFYSDNGGQSFNTSPGVSGFNASRFESYYSPPIRIWNWDTNFQDPNKNPPGVPMVRSFTQGQWARSQ